MYAALACLKLMGWQEAGEPSCHLANAARLSRSSARKLVATMTSSVAHKLLSALKSAQKTEGFD